MAAQDGHAGCKFLERRHHCHWYTIYEFEHGNSADRTITGREEPRYTEQGGTGLAEATQGLVPRGPRVRLLRVRTVPVSKAT